ncbi:MAG: hypothetical protein K0R14_1795 [Burkholderiales bacterium]|nr:hypothetical protein [Burkholderiales bacterium]
MKLRSYIKKFVGRVTTATLLRRSFIYPNMYLLNLKKPNLPKVQKILFYFNAPEFMHLGDHLFFLPLIKTFIDSGYQIEVDPAVIMRGLFEKLGIPIAGENTKLTDYDLIVSRVELFDKLINHKSLLVDVARNLSMPICDQLISQFSQYFALKRYVAYDFTVLKSYDILQKMHLSPKYKYILFNFYCDSSSFLITKDKVNRLVEKVKSYANLPGYKVVLVGSPTDKDGDNYIYDFNYIDLRGQTTVLDIFALAQSDNVLHYIGFDAFVMHVFSLVSKTSFVVFRGRIGARQHKMLEQFHVHLFKDDSYVKLIPGAPA